MRGGKEVGVGVEFIMGAGVLGRLGMRCEWDRRQHTVAEAGALLSRPISPKNGYELNESCRLIPSSVAMR